MKLRGIPGSFRVVQPKAAERPRASPGRLLPPNRKRPIAEAKPQPGEPEPLPVGESKEATT